MQANEPGFRVTRYTVQSGGCYLDPFLTLQLWDLWASTSWSPGVCATTGGRSRSCVHLKLWLPPGRVRLPEIALIVTRR